MFRNRNVQCHSNITHGTTATSSSPSTTTTITTKATDLELHKGFMTGHNQLIYLPQLLREH